VISRGRSLFFILTMLATSQLMAKPPIVELRIKNHVFIPAEIIIPSNQKVKLLVINDDETPEEFESYELNREKIIPAKSRSVIFIGPLNPGTYPFFGEFNPKTAQGLVRVE